MPTCKETLPKEVSVLHNLLHDPAIPTDRAIGFPFRFHILPALPSISNHNRRAPAHNTPTEASFRKEKERTIMSNNSSNKLNVPQAKQGMEQFKMLTRQ